MPETIRETAENKPLPPPVALAQRVLAGLPPARREEFAGLLPALAVALDRNGQQLSPAVLEARLEKGAEACRAELKELKAAFNKAAASSPASQKTYKSILASLKKKKIAELWKLASILDTDILNRVLLPAACLGDLELVRHLHGQSTNIVWTDFGQVLYEASRNGHIQIVRYMWNCFGGDIEWHAYFPLKQALVSAAANGHLGIVRYLHEHGADIRAMSNAALRHAAKNGHLETVTYLCEHGADIMANNDEALIWAAKSGHLEIVRYLHEHGADVRASYASYGSALPDAAANGHLEIVRYLHKRGTNIRALNDAALRLAAENGHLETVRYLHGHGANIRVDGDHALRKAAEKGHFEVVRYLHKHGADIRADDDYALRYSIAGGHFEIMRYLHEHGADIRSYNSSILHYPSKGGHFEVARYLHEHGVRLNTAIYQKGFDRLDLWKEKAGTCPPVLECLSPYYFQPEAFAAACQALEREGYKDETARQYAYHAAGLFGTAGRLFVYLEAHGDGASKQPLHDIVQNIRLPQAGRFDLRAWGDAVLKHGPKMARLVKFADRLPQPEKDAAGKGWSYARTKAAVARFAYANGGEHPELAALCFEYEWDEGDFEKAREAVAQYAEKYPGGRKRESRIPAVDIDGGAFGKDGCRFYKLPDGDPRGLFLGEFTNCCQHFAGEGAECARHGFLFEDGGFYVVADRKKDAVVAQAWAWRGEKGELVFDSLESLPGHMSAQNWGSLCREFAAALEKTGAEGEDKITAFNIGTGGATPSLDFPGADDPAKPRSYKGYRDSGGQYTVRRPV